MVEHKKNGYVAKYLDVEDLVRGFLWIYNNNSKNVLGIAGREKVEKQYAMNVVADKYNQLYEDIIAHRL